MLFGDPTLTKTVTSPPLTPPACIPPLSYLAHLFLPSANAALPSHPRLQTSSTHFLSSPFAPSSPHRIPGCFSIPLASFFPDFLRVLQWNVEGLRARSTKLLHFISSHSIALTCIQESNFNLSSSFQMPGFSALQSDRTHSRSGILSPDTTHARDGIIIFVKQGSILSELSTSSLSLLDPSSDYVGVNISKQLLLAFIP